MPDFPSLIAVHVVFNILPSGVTAPIPVITTLAFHFSSTPLDLLYFLNYFNGI